MQRPGIWSSTAACNDHSMAMLCVIPSLSYTNSWHPAPLQQCMFFRASSFKCTCLQLDYSHVWMAWPVTGSR
eukprot:240341-Chlamydomonas_euryale.AAC.5